MTEEEPKLHIDDDWKSEAAAEKTRLSEEANSSEQPQMPQASLSAIVQLLAMQAMIGLGGYSQGDHQIPPNLEVGKHHIDLLDVLQSKTRGNLDEDEKQLLDTSLHQLRMAYVQAIGGAPPPGAAQ